MSVTKRSITAREVAVMSRYENMMPKDPKAGKLGYYPVCNKEEWEELPDVYKYMDWFLVPDHLDGGKKKAVKEVVFDVVYMEPYKIRAKVSVHPQDIQKIMFCLFGKSQCHLYRICGVVLEGGTVRGAKWLQDTTTGAFKIVSGGYTVAVQGGCGGYICGKKKEEGVITRYEYSNPFGLVIKD